MFANLLIGLREGLEASLIIGILIAYLVKTNRRDVIDKVWTGVGIAVLLSIGVGFILVTGLGELEGPPENLVAASLSIAAAGLVTWMVFWMAKTARNLKGSLESEVERSLTGTGVGLMFVAFLAVAREGIETALFIWAAASASGETALPLIGAIIGLGIAALLGFLIYRGALRLDLRKFFAWSGAFLIIIAAAVLLYAVAELQEGGFLPGEDNLAFDINGSFNADSWYGVLLHGTVGFNPAMSVLQVITWVLYVGITMTLFLRLVTARKTIAPAAEAVEGEKVSA